MRIIKEIYWSKGKKKPRIVGQYFFMHIPKTAGTTVRFLFYDAFDDSSLYPSAKTLRDNGGAYVSQRKLIENKKTIASNGLIIGHYTYNLVRHLDASVKTITFIREPIARTMSHVKHIIRHESNYSNCTASEVLSGCQKRLTNLQSRMMGYHAGDHNIDTLLENLCTIDYVGVTEHLSDSIYELNEHFGWNLKYNPRKDRNVASSSDEIIFSAADIAFIESINQVDLMIYNKWISK